MTETSSSCFSLEHMILQVLSCRDPDRSCPLQGLDLQNRHKLTYLELGDLSVVSMMFTEH